jgi:hypothetical protein
MSYTRFNKHYEHVKNGVRLTRRIWVIVIVCASIIFVIAAAFVSNILIFVKHMTIMKNSNSNETRTALRSMFDRDYNFTELFQWEHEKVEFAYGETFERSDDPLRILQIGKGACEEFSVLYLALCLAHGYQCRLVVALDVSYRILWFLQHGWAEVKLGNQWVHVDPSDQVWNQTSHYRNWSWGKGIGSYVQIYAFEDGKVTDVTQHYKSDSGV